VHRTTERHAHACAVDSELDVAFVIEHCILYTVGIEIDNYGEPKLTRIIVRIMLADPKAAFAGAMFSSSFARSKPSTAMVKVEINLSWPLRFRVSEDPCIGGRIGWG
jgi:hypothetical protein